MNEIEWEQRTMKPVVQLRRDRPRGRRHCYAEEWPDSRALLSPKGPMPRGKRSQGGQSGSEDVFSTRKREFT